ncbi:MAG TPA: 3-dehydroquinate synthase [Limnochordia bacterium]|nr:3-dehydroquinate synthase [Limnochordia bacterium]
MVPDVRVQLGERSYAVVIGPGALASLGSRMQGLGLGRRALLVSNPTVAPLHAPALKQSLAAAGFVVHEILLPDGEAHKSLASVSRLYDAALAAGLDRKDPFVALGGGVVGDTTGFAAATYLRGVPFVQVPTSLEAQVDASIGGKTAVNHPRGKNLIGAFHQPALVACDPAALTTLPKRDLQAGMAEVIKHGLIRDVQLLAYCEAQAAKVLAGDPAALTHVVVRSCEIKGAVVEADERESGERAILNFGHTVGHAVEAQQAGALRHGEAVAIGMVSAALLSEGRGLITAAETARIVAALKPYGLPVRLPAGTDRAGLMAHMRHDKKRVGEHLRFVLLRGLGETVLAEVEPAEIHAALDRQEVI